MVDWKLLELQFLVLPPEIRKKYINESPDEGVVGYFTALIDSRPGRYL